MTSRNDYTRVMVEDEGENAGGKAKVKQAATSVQRGVLDDEIKRVLKRRDQIITGYFICLPLGVLLLVVGVAFLIAYARASDAGSAWLILGIATSAPAAGGLVAVPPLKARIRSHEARLLDLTFERDVLYLEPTNSEIRADKLLRMNQQQLRRYYEMNLQQNAWVFIVGLACLGLGIGVIIGTFYMIDTAPRGSNTEKAIIAAVGGVGSILTNFVAAVYLKIHAASARSVSEFHENLVRMQQIFLANLIAASVSPDTHRSETFAKLSLGMLGRILNDDKPVNGSSDGKPGIGVSDLESTTSGAPRAGGR